MPAKLTDQQIKQKLQEGRNYKQLYGELKLRFDEVKAENKQLKLLLAEQRAYFEAIIETQNARITELETMIFGRKPSGGVTAKTEPLRAKIPRTPESYRRPMPPASAITAEEQYATNACHRCGHKLTNKEEGCSLRRRCCSGSADTRRTP